MLYLETSSLVAYTLTRAREPDRYQEMAQLVAKINGGQLQAVTSFYALLELYTVAVINAASPQQGAKDGKEALLEILKTEIDLIVLLKREERLIHARRFAALRDSDDVPHAITAYLHGCQAVVTYDSHFQAITDVLPCGTPGELLVTLAP